MNKLSNYIFIEKLQKDITIISYVVTFIFAVLFLFFFELNPKSFIFASLMLLFINLCTSLLAENYVLAKYNSNEFWTSPVIVFVDGIQYSVISKLQHFNCESVNPHTEDRYFSNGLLSHHKQAAIQDGLFTSDVPLSQRFWYNGVRLPNRKAVVQQHKIQQTTKFF